MAKAAAKKSTVKKAPPTKTAKKEYEIKYSDKSPGQPQLVPIFNELAKIMEPFAKGSIIKTGGTNGQVNLSSKKPVEIAGRQLNELFFAGALVQKGYVGFYYFPVYVCPEIKLQLGTELQKCLKGKSCFYIKKMDAEIFSQVKDALKKGYDLYKKNGWIS